MARRGVIVVGVVLLLAAVGALAAFQLRSSAANLRDGEYVGIAKSTPQGQAYFRRFAAATCTVSRGWDVTVNCDYPQTPPLPPYVEKFRVYIDPIDNAVLEVEIQTNAP